MGAVGATFVRAVQDFFPVARPLFTPFEGSPTHRADPRFMSIFGSSDAGHDYERRDNIANSDTVGNMDDVVLALNVLATWTMVGVIWFVQIVHYPLLSVVPVESAASVAIEHQRRTGWVVAAPMAIEGVTTLLLLAMVPVGVAWYVPWLAGIPLAIALGATVFLSVPRHERMAREPDDQVGRELVTTNWVRTIAWTLRGLIVAAMLLVTLSERM